MTTKKFGIVPEVSLDFKAVSNPFGVPLVEINGRDNSGSLFTFFIDFIADETSESLVWVLESLKSIVNGSLSSFAIDQSTSIMAAIKKVFPVSYITLDE